MDAIDVRAPRGRLAARVVDFCHTMERIVARGREPGFSANHWQPLAAYLDAERFVRVGPFHDALDWPAYEAFLTDWARTSEGWRPVFKRIIEAPGIVFLELDEMVTRNGQTTPFHSLSVYEFDEAGRIRRLDVYMQAPAGGEGGA